MFISKMIKDNKDGSCQHRIVVYLLDGKFCGEFSSLRLLCAVILNIVIPSISRMAEARDLKFVAHTGYTRTPISRNWGPWII